MAAEIEEGDLISKGALEAPNKLAGEVDKVTASLNRLYDSTKKSMAAIADAKSITKLKDETTKLTGAQVELQKIGTQITIARAKNNDAYAKEARTLKATNDEIKNRIALEGQDAKAIDAKTASLEKLDAAIKANNQSYAKLDATQRNSPGGKALLANINAQQAAQKKLRSEMGQTTQFVGDYAGQISKISPKLGGFISLTNEMTTAALAFVATPLGATIAAIGLVLSPVISFLTSTGDGMDLVAEKTEAFKNVIDVLQDKLNDFGKHVIEGDTALGKFFKTLVETNPIVVALSAEFQLLKASMPGLTKELEAAAKQGVAYAQALDQVKTEAMFVSLQNDRDENQIKRLMIQSRNRAKTEDERIEKVKEVGELEEKINERNTISKLNLLHIEIENANLRSKLVKKDGEDDLAFAERVAKAMDATDEDVRDKLLKALHDVSQVESETLAIEETASRREEELRKAKSDRLEKEAAAREKALEDQRKAAEKAASDQKKLLDDTFAWDKKNIEKKFQADVNASEKRLGILLSEKSEEEKIMDEQDHKNAERRSQELKAEEDLAKAIVDLKKNAQAGVISITENLTAQELQGIDKQIQANKDKEEQAILLAGDNAKQKDKIQKDFAKKEESLQKQKVAAQRRQAIFEKALGITQAVIATAKAVAEALPNLVLAGIAAAIGAIQITTIATKPIPQFARGTKSAPGGQALVSEEGPEAMFRGGHFVGLTPSEPTVMDIPAMTEIVPNKRTMQMLAMAGMDNRQSGGTSQDFLTYKLIEKLDEVKTTIANSKGPEIDHIRSGQQLIETIKYRDGHRSYVRSLSFGKWL